MSTKNPLTATIMMSLLVGASLAARSQTPLNETPAESSQISAAALPPRHHFQWERQALPRFHY